MFCAFLPQVDSATHLLGLGFLLGSMLCRSFDMVIRGRLLHVGDAREQRRGEISEEKRLLSESGRSFGSMGSHE